MTSNITVALQNCIKIGHLCSEFNVTKRDKSEGVDFKYGYSFFKFYSKNAQKKRFLVQNLVIFILTQNFATREIRRG